MVIIITTQEISVAHNPELKARAQCAHRKTQNKLPIQKTNKKKNQKNKALHNYHTVDNYTINEI